MDAGLIELFGPWLWWLFGIGLILFISGLAAKRAAPIFEMPAARRAGRLATDLGLRIVIAAVACYLAIWALSRVF